MRSAVLMRGRDAVGQRRRQAEAAVNGLQQLELEGLVVEADGGLEGADEVADHVLGRIVQQRGEAPARGSGPACMAPAISSTSSACWATEKA